MNNDNSCDLFVIGAGSGGVRAARISAGLGAKVIVAEGLYLGGTCVNVGCVPKKLYVYGSEFGKAFKEAEGFGWTVTGTSFDWPTLRDNKTREISRLNSIYDRLLDGSGAQVISGMATLIDAHTVEVNGTRYHANKILLATGSGLQNLSFRVMSLPLHRTKSSTLIPSHSGYWLWVVVISRPSLPASSMDWAPRSHSFTAATCSCVALIMTFEYCC